MSNIVPQVISCFFPLHHCLLPAYYQESSKYSVCICWSMAWSHTTHRVTSITVISVPNWVPPQSFSWSFCICNFSSQRIFSLVPGTQLPHPGWPPASLSTNLTTLGCTSFFSLHFPDLSCLWFSQGSLLFLARNNHIHSMELQPCFQKTQNFPSPASHLHPRPWI